MNKKMLMLAALLSLSSWASSELENQCAIDLCGAPGVHPTAILFKKNHDQYVLPGTLERYAEIERAVEQKVRESTRSNAALIAHMKSKTANMQDFYDFGKWKEKDYNKFKKLFYDPHFTIQIDPTRPANEKYTLILQVPQNSSPVFEKGLREYANSKKRGMESQDLPAGSKVPDVCEGDCKAGLEEKLKSFDLAAIIASFEEANVFETALATNKQSCKGSLMMAGLKSGDVEGFRKEFVTLKEEFHKKIGSKFTEHSQKALKDFFDQLELKFNPSGSQADVDRFIQRMNNISPSGEVDHSKISNPDIAHQLISNHIHGNGRFETGTSICRPGSPFVLWDSFNSRTENEILISLFSTTHHSFGKGLVAHELGHALSHAFLKKILDEESEKEFNKLRQCSTNFYKVPVVGQGALYRPGDTMRTEEDNADTISYLVHPDPDAIFGCAMIDIDSNLKYIKPTLDNLNTRDVHSSHLLRAVREAVHKNKRLPNSCKNLMEQSKDRYNFAKCF